MMPKNMLGTNKLGVQYSLPYAKRFDLVIFGSTKSERSKYALEQLKGSFTESIELAIGSRSLDVLAFGKHPHVKHVTGMEFTRLFRAMMFALRTKIERPMTILIEISEIPRSILGAIIGQLYSDKMFDTLDLVYTQANYAIQNNPAVAMYNDDIFLQSVLENASEFIPVPFVGGRYSSSHRMSLFVSCGLDARLLLPRLRALEPHRIELTLPDDLRAQDCLQKIGLSSDEHENLPPSEMEGNIHVTFILNYCEAGILN